MITIKNKIETDFSLSRDEIRKIGYLNGHYHMHKQETIELNSVYLKEIIYFVKNGRLPENFNVTDDFLDEFEYLCVEKPDLKKEKVLELNENHFYKPNKNEIKLYNLDNYFVLNDNSICEKILEMNERNKVMVCNNNFQNIDWKRLENLKNNFFCKLADHLDLAIAGGFLTGILTNGIMYDDSDIDFFIISKEKRKISNIIEKLKSFLNIDEISYHLSEKTISFNLVHKIENQLKRHKIQIILYEFDFVEYLLDSFDISCCKFAYYKNKLYGTTSSIFSINYKLNILFKDKFTSNTCSRVMKYFARGFGFSIETENNNGRIDDSLLGVCNYMQNFKNTNLPFLYRMTYKWINVLNEYYGENQKDIKNLYPKHSSFSEIKTVIQDLETKELDIKYSDFEKEINKNLHSFKFEVKLINNLPFA